MPEVDEIEYAQTQRLNKILEVVNKNDAARAKLQEALEIALPPEEVGPEIRMRKEVNGRLDAFEKKIDEFLSAQTAAAEKRTTDDATKALESRWLQGRAKLRDQGWMDDGIEKLEKMMEDKGIASHEDASIIYERLNPPPKPEMTGGSRWNFFDQAQDGSAVAAAYKNLMDGNEEAFLGTMVNQAINDVRNGR